MMNHRKFVLFGGLALTPVVVALPAAHAVFGPVAQGADETVVDTPTALDAAEWRVRLTDPDLDRREAELDRFLELARSNAGARGLLEGWAHAGDDGELAWTARLALRALADEPVQQQDPLDWGSGFGWRGDPFAGSQRDGLAHLFGGRWSDIQGELERLRSMYDPQPGRAPGPPQPGLSQGFELSITPDGAKCRVREDVDGVEEVREYEAGSLEELLENNPELEGRVRLDALAPGVNWGERFPMLDRMLTPRAQTLVPQQRLAPRAHEQRTDVLGVYVREIEDDDSARWGLAPGEGLVVLRTEPGTIADALGIQRGNVLLEVNGIRAAGRESISQALCDRAEDGAVQVVVIDNRGQRRTRTWRRQEELEDALRRGLEEHGRKF